MRVVADWIEDAVTGGSGHGEANAMAVATVDAFGSPRVRMLLCKEIDPVRAAFRFFTNTESCKATDIAANERVSLLFWWPVQHRQVRVDGAASSLPADEVASYFQTRPRGAQVGAHASCQSRAITGRDVLDEQAAQARLRFEDARADVPVPAHWGGYDVVADEVELWQGRPDRLHDRIVFRRDGDGTPPPGWEGAATLVTDDQGARWWRARLQP